MRVEDRGWKKGSGMTDEDFVVLDLELTSKGYLVLSVFLRKHKPQPISPNFQTLDLDADLRMANNLPRAPPTLWSVVRFTSRGQHQPSSAMYLNPQPRGHMQTSVGLASPPPPSHSPSMHPNR